MNITVPYTLHTDIPLLTKQFIVSGLSLKSQIKPAKMLAYDLHQTADTLQPK